jgi:hypothetical protein
LVDFDMVHHFFRLVGACLLLFPLASQCSGQRSLSAGQLERLLKRFPAADTNKDGELTIEEAVAHRNKLTGRGAAGADAASSGRGRRGGTPRTFEVNPGWDLDEFPEHAMCYQTPEEIKAVFAQSVSERQPSVVSYPEPNDGALRIVGVGHSFMAPGYKTLPFICAGAGMTQPLYTHTGGGMTGSARYKWEQENGIFQFDGRPLPKLLASISNGTWDAMMFGPYYNDRPAYYACWIDFCLKYNPEMKFYLSDAWPQLDQLDKNPDSESFFTSEIIDEMGAEKRATYAEVLAPLREAYPGRVFVLPTSDAMVLAAKHFLRGELPGVEGLHRAIGKKERSLWRDQLGHLGPGFERLEGYVFYATLYRKSPEHIKTPIKFGGSSDFPSSELDAVFREIAWRAVANHPHSGVVDRNKDGFAD